jgi:hypothetical protein
MRARRVGLGGRLRLHAKAETDNPAAFGHVGEHSGDCVDVTVAQIVQEDCRLVADAAGPAAWISTLAFLKRHCFLLVN